MQPRRWSEEPPFATDINPPCPCGTHAEIARDVLMGTGTFPFELPLNGECLRMYFFDATRRKYVRCHPQSEGLTPLAPNMYRFSHSSQFCIRHFAEIPHLAEICTSQSVQIWVEWASEAKPGSDLGRMGKRNEPESRFRSNGQQAISVIHIRAEWTSEAKLGTQLGRVSNKPNRNPSLGRVNKRNRMDGST